MRGAKEIFSVAGYPIHVHFTFLILVALFVFPGWGDSLASHGVQLAWVPILFGAILIHELGHAYMLKKKGYGRSKIMLWGMGGVCINRRGRRSPKDGMWISLAGPIAGAIPGLLAIPFLFFDLGPVVSALTFNVLLVTIGFSIFNLLPIFPLDGGHVLVYALRHFSKRRDRKEWAIKRAGLVGLITLVPLALASLYFMEIWMLFILLFIGHQSWQAYKQGSRAINM